MHVDLHLHTVFSGDATPAVDEVFDLAAKRGLAAIAITDHDSVDGIAAARSAASRTGVCLVPGVEATCTFDDRSVHVLVFSDRVDCGRFRGYLETEIRNALRRYAEPIVAAVAAHGVPVTMAMYDEELVRGGAGGSPLARVLQKRGIVRDARDMAQRIGPLIPKEIERRAWGPPLGRLLEVTREIDATAVLAHPAGGQSYAHFSIASLDDARRAGIDGLEALHPNHSRPDQEWLRQYASQHGLLMTGGSDYHGYPPRQLGVPGLTLPDRSLPAVIHLKNLL